MAELRDLPRLVEEFGTMARDYLVQETVDPARRLGRFALMSVVAAVAWLVGAVLLAVAALRGVLRLLPDGPYYQALGYLVVAVVALVAVAAILRLASRGGPPGHGEGR